MGQVYSLVITYNVAGQFSQSVLHYQCTEAGAFDATVWARELTVAFQAAHRTRLRALLPTDSNILSYRSRRVSAPGGSTALAFENTGTGTWAGNVTAAGLGVVLDFPVHNAGKNVTGKFIVPGVAQDVWSEGTVNPTFATAAGNFAIGLLTPLVGSVSASSFTFGVYKRPKRVPPTPEAFTAALHTNFSAKPVMLRRRNVPT